MPSKDEIREKLDKLIAAGVVDPNVRPELSGPALATVEALVEREWPLYLARLEQAETIRWQEPTREQVREQLKEQMPQFHLAPAELSVDKPRRPITHDLKCWPKFFPHVFDNSKPFEVRKRDRDYRVGDRLLLREWNPDDGTYSGRSIERAITYVLTADDAPWALEHGFCVLGLR